MADAGSALGGAELLAVAWEALNEVAPALRARGCVVRLNHSSLLRAVLLHCGLEDERHSEITSILSEARVSHV